MSRDCVEVRYHYALTCKDVVASAVNCYVLIKIDWLYIAERPKQEYFSDSYLICCRGAAKVRQMLRVEQGRSLCCAIPAVTFAWYGICGPPHLFACCDKQAYSDARLVNHWRSINRLYIGDAWNPKEDWLIDRFTPYQQYFSHVTPVQKRKVASSIQRFDNNISYNFIYLLTCSFVCSCLCCFSIIHLETSKITSEGVQM